jgi:ribonuclease III
MSGALPAAGEAAAALEQRLGYRFADSALLREALTHSSATGHGRRAVRSNERLEFLGDRVLGLVIAELLIRRFVREGEGALSRRLAALVRRDTLAELALELGLGQSLVLARSEDDTGGRSKPATLANGLEALIGALYLDGGLAPAAAFIERHFGPRLAAMRAPPQDPKTALQEWAQGCGLGLPDYRVVEVAGPAHEPRFEVSVQVGERPPATAIAGSKRAAEQAAAERLLGALATEIEGADD